MDSERNIFITVVIIYFILISNCLAASDDLPYKEGELLVKFAPKARGIHRSAIERNQILSSFNAGRVKHSFKRVQGLTLVKLPENLKVKDALSKFKGKNEILYAEPNYKIKLLSIFSNDPCAPNPDSGGKQWALHNIGQSGGTEDADIDAPEAWDVITDSDVIVAVVDSGVDYNHPDLKANMWINPGEDHLPLGIVGPEDFDGINDDNNYDSNGISLIDDIYGWNFAGDNNDVNDCYSHGTHVAGIIGASGNNGIGVTGVCWNVKIMALKISQDNTEGSEIFASNGIKAIEYAVDKGARVINASWTLGGYDSNGLKDSIDAANAAGVLFIAAAGGDGEGVNLDSGNSGYPACYDCDNIICVLATNERDTKTGTSNFGPISVDLGAPGGEGWFSENDILSTIPGGGYGHKSGTSMAAPHVAGACALVWAEYPQLTHLQVKEAIMGSVDELAGLNGLCVTGGRLNLYNAVTYYNHPLDVALTVTDNNTCVDPSVDGIDSFINYTICYDTNSYSVNDVNIVDYLPVDVNFNSCTGGGIYNSNTHTVRWTLGDLDVNDTNCFTLTVRVAEDVILGHYITNTVKMYNGPNLIRTAEEQTRVCCYDTILYVDKDANGTGDGSDWANGYNELRDALTVIRGGDYPCIDQIWVAAGTYKPTNDANDIYATFEMLDGVDVYGHFAGYECSIEQRNLADANFTTILTGDINDDEDGDVNNVVTAVNSRLDGFTVVKCRPYLGDDTAGVFCNSCSTTIANCIITGNGHHGIHCENGANATIINTFINNNNIMAVSCDGLDGMVLINIDRCTLGPGNSYGLYAIQNCLINAKDTIFGGNSHGIYVSSSDLTVERCSVNNNGNSGIYIYSTSYISTVITNSIIHHNNSYGIYLEGYDLTCKIRNNTIADNGSFGIRKNGGAEPNISSNIIWGNTGGSLNGTFGSVNYNCIQGGFGSGIGNIASDPCFVDVDANDYHLSDDSNCIEAGDPNFVPETGETDIDGEDRIMDGDRSGDAKVDMGADEFYHVRADIYPPGLPDGIVDFLDFRVFAKSWRTSQGQPGYNDVCDFCDDGVIDYKDLYIFCFDWLWITISE